MKPNFHTLHHQGALHPLARVLIGGLLEHGELTADQICKVAESMALSGHAVRRALGDLGDRGLICPAPERDGVVFLGTLRLTRLEQEYRVRALVAYAERVRVCGHA